jgi:hypothetical protein
VSLPELLIEVGALLDRPALRSALPDAWGSVLAERSGGDPAMWAAAYRRLLSDWSAYWADLDLSGDDALAHWREGRWRIVRAHYRLAGFDPPPLADLPVYLDELPRAVGEHIDAWLPDVPGVLRRLADQGASLAIVAPYNSAALIDGMLRGAGLRASIGAVLGPDELGQPGLEGVSPAHLARLAGLRPARVQIITELNTLLEQTS